MAESAVIHGVGKLVEYSADAIKKQVRYLCCYSCNVQTLADEVGELNIRHQSVQQDVDAARANFGVIKPEVEAWLRKVEDLKTRSNEIRGDAEEVKRSCLCKRFPVLHYSLSRKALKTTNDSVQLRNIEFHEISIPGILADIPPARNTSIVEFESRVSIENQILDVLKDPSVYSVGIWGIGGVGKTVMAKKIEEIVRDEKSFERVVMVVVSQLLDIQKIQSQIAEALCLSLTEESLELRQRKLHKRLVVEKGILIILDDLWERLDVEEIGIPSQSAHPGCKLILTSRNWDALTSTGVSVGNIFQLEILTKEESWKFFTDNVGMNLDDHSHDELVQIAKKVERECMRLPLALKIVAFALKGKGISFWNNAVRELEKQTPDNIPGVAKEVYGSLLFSINALEGKEQKDLFLLCCLFPEDYIISTEELLGCGMGLGIFKELENLTEVRDKLESVLSILVSRSLLIEETNHLESVNVRMHDVIRDVGIWIATKGKEIEKHAFLIKHGVNEWPIVEDDSSSNYTHISLVFFHYRITSPEAVVFPKLEFLRFDFNRRGLGKYYLELSENFFIGMSGLRVLQAHFIELLPPSMCQLNNLRTLSLQFCKIFESISVLGKMINLEILSLEFCEFEVLPMEIGNLKKLKQMYIFRCKNLRRIAFGVVSGLVRLEELVILDCFDNWEAEGREEKDVACLSELNDLENITTLRIEIRNPSVVPRQKPLWVQKLKKYDIAVSKCSFNSGFKFSSLFGNDLREKRFQKAILLGKEVENPFEDWIYDMTSGVEYINLDGSNCKKFVEGLFENSRNLSCLKELRLSNFNDIQYLVEGPQNSAIFPVLESLCINFSSNLQQISEVSPPTGSFMALQRIYLIWLRRFVCLWKFSINEQLYLSNLQEVCIHCCDNLSHLFSLTVARSLVQLSHLSIRECESIKEIFKREDGELVEINKIKLPKLRKIGFLHLHSFYRLCSEIDRIELPELCDLNICNLPRMKMTNGDNNEVHQKYLISKVDVFQGIGISFNFCVLQRLRVIRIENFKCMFSPSVFISKLPNLRYLSIEACSMLEEVIGKDHENVGRAITFPNLMHLKLLNLPNIRTFCYNTTQFPSLTWLHVNNCPLMLEFVGLTNHISNSRPFLDKQVHCHKLKELTLDGLNISGVFPPLFFKSLTVLEKLVLNSCEELEHLFFKEGQTAEEEFIQIIPLKAFYLIKMPKLYGSVFPMKHNMKFPSLEEIIIEDCPMLEKFSTGSPHLPNLKSVSGLQSAESVANFFSYKEIFSREIHLENMCFIIPIKDISFSSNTTLHFLRLNSSESFADTVSNDLNGGRNVIVGKFKIENVRIGIEYKVVLMIMLLKRNWSDESFEIELKLPEGSELQRTEMIIENHPRDTWLEIPIGKFVGESQQSKQLEFSLSFYGFSCHIGRILSIKGVKIVEV